MHALINYTIIITARHREMKINLHSVKDLVLILLEYHYFISAIPVKTANFYFFLLIKCARYFVYCKFQLVILIEISVLSFQKFRSH